MTKCPPSTARPTAASRNAPQAADREILSPARFDLTEKRDGWTLPAAFQDGDDIRAAPFEALAFPLNALWPD